MEEQHFLVFLTYLGFPWKGEFGKAFHFCAHHYECQQAAQDWKHWIMECLLKVVQVHPVLAPPVRVHLLCWHPLHAQPDLGVHQECAPVLHSCGGSWEVPNGLQTEKIPV